MVETVGWHRRASWQVIVPKPCHQELHGFLVSPARQARDICGPVGPGGPLLQKSIREKRRTSKPLLFDEFAFLVPRSVAILLLHRVIDQIPSTRDQGSLCAEDPEVADLDGTGQTLLRVNTIPEESMTNKRLTLAIPPNSLLVEEGNTQPQ